MTGMSTTPLVRCGTRASRLLAHLSKSLKAFANLRRLCEEHLAGQYEIEIVDLVTPPARSDDIIAIPTLVRSSLEPVRRTIGDLSNTERRHPASERSG